MKSVDSIFRVYEEDHYPEDRKLAVAVERIEVAHSLPELKCIISPSQDVIFNLHVKEDSNQLLNKRH